MKCAAQFLKGCVPGLILAAFLGLACTDENLYQKKAQEQGQPAKTRGLIVGFEGMQPFSLNLIDNLTKEVGEDMHMVHASSSGFHWAHLPLVRSAHTDGQPIYIVGYSLGAGEAMALVRECGKANITVDILFMLDAGASCAFADKIPRNVRKVVFYQSSSCDGFGDGSYDRLLEDPGHTRVEVEDLSNRNHFSLPPGLAGKLEAEILGGR